MASDEESKISSKSINMLASVEEEDDDDDDDLSNKGDLFNLDPQYIAEKARLRHPSMANDSSDESSDEIVEMVAAKPAVIPPSASRRLEATQTTCVAWLSQPVAMPFEVRRDVMAAKARKGLAKSTKEIPTSITVVAEKENTMPATQLTGITTATVAPGKNWPHMGKLMPMPILVYLLRAVDETGCTGELNASNADNPKGNKWSRLYDHCFGGVLDVQDNEAPRGLLGGHLSVLLSSSKLKTKIQKIWEYVAKAIKEENHKVPSEVVIMCQRQMSEYEEAKQAEKDANKKQKERDVELREKMAEYEKNVGSVTPGAIGIEGGGRRQHSTNLNVEEPAANAYANASTTTPKQSKSNSKSNSTSKNSSLSTSGSTELHMHSFAGFNRFSDRFENICDRHFGSSSSNRTGSSEKERKRRRLLAAKKITWKLLRF